MISDLRSRLEKEKRGEKVSSLTRGLDGRIVMNIKGDTYIQAFHKAYGRNMIDSFPHGCHQTLCHKEPARGKK